MGQFKISGKMFNDSIKNYHGTKIWMKDLKFLQPILPYTDYYKQNMKLVCGPFGIFEASYFQLPNQGSTFPKLRIHFLRK